MLIRGENVGMISRFGSLSDYKLNVTRRPAGSLGARQRGTRSPARRPGRRRPGVAYKRYSDFGRQSIMAGRNGLPDFAREIFFLLKTVVKDRPRPVATGGARGGLSPPGKI